MVAKDYTVDLNKPLVFQVTCPFLYGLVSTDIHFHIASLLLHMSLSIFGWNTVATRYFLSPITKGSKLRISPVGVCCLFCQVGCK